jgi:hypothetical protein
MTARRSVLVSVIGAAITVILGMVTIGAATPADDKCTWPCHSPRWWPGKVLAVVS